MVGVGSGLGESWVRRAANVHMGFGTERPTQVYISPDTQAACSPIYGPVSYPDNPSVSRSLLPIGSTPPRNWKLRCNLPYSSSAASNTADAAAAGGSLDVLLCSHLVSAQVIPKLSDPVFQSHV